MQKDEIRGLYFPYANIESAKTIKTAVLYFDRIGIINPYLSFCTKSISRRGLYRESHDYIDEMNLLVKENIIEWVDPVEVIGKFGHEIMTGVIQDINDPKFLDLCKSFVKSAWLLSSVKLPDDSDKWLRNVLVNIPTLAREGSTLTEEIRERLYRYGFRETGPYFDERMHMRERGRFSEGGPSRYDDEYESQLLRGKMFDKYRIVELPFAVGESIMIGHALAAAANSDLIPFCDERIHLDTLKTRFKKLCDSKAFKAVLYEYGYLKNVKMSMLAQDVITETVPSLEQVPLEIILRFREKKNAELKNFRVEMLKLVTEIESNPWDSDFPNYVSDIVDSRVKPALKEVENEIHGCRDAFWAKAIETFGKVTPIPFVGSVFAGVPTHVALGIGATLSGLTLILERWAKMRKIKRNGWGFLLDTGQLAGRKVR